MSIFGLLLMSAAVLYLGWKVLRSNGRMVSFGLVEIFVIPLMWMAGRALAGRSIVDFLLN